MPPVVPSRQYPPDLLRPLAFMPHRGGAGSFALVTPARLPRARAGMGPQNGPGPSTRGWLILRPNPLPIGRRAPRLLPASSRGAWVRGVGAGRGCGAHAPDDALTAAGARESIIAPSGPAASGGGAGPARRGILAPKGGGLPTEAPRVFPRAGPPSHRSRPGPLSRPRETDPRVLRVPHTTPISPVRRGGPSGPGPSRPPRALARAPAP
jgi:hypothetical protein